MLGQRIARLSPQAAASTRFSLPRRSADVDPNAAIALVWQIGRKGDDEAAKLDGWRDADQRDQSSRLQLKRSRAQSERMLHSKRIRSKDLDSKQPSSKPVPRSKDIRTSKRLRSERISSKLQSKRGAEHTLQAHQFG